VPAGFDVDGFLKGARQQFVRLQAARQRQSGRTERVHGRRALSGAVAPDHRARHCHPAYRRRAARGRTPGCRDARPGIRGQRAVPRHDP
jgi:hypothetical protein